MGDEIVDLSYSGWEPVTDRQLDVVRQQNREKNAEIVQLRTLLRGCRARLAELVAAEDELDRLGRYLRDPDVDEHEWDAAWARIEQRREHAIDAMRDWLAAHPAEEARDE